MKLSPILATLALFACAPAPGDDAAANATQAPAARGLEGEYVVTHVNEADPATGFAGEEPTVTIAADRIHFQSQCIYQDWSYTRDGEDIQTGPFRYDEPPAMCARGLAIGETAIIEAIGAAETVRFVHSGLWLSGAKGTVQMRRLPSDRDLAGRTVDLTGSWLVQALDGRELPFALALEADFEQVWWEPGCAGQAVNYAINGSAFNLRQRDSVEMVCEIGFPPEVPEIWSAMAAAESVERTANGGVLISGNARSVLLVPHHGSD